MCVCKRWELVHVLVQISMRGRAGVVRCVCLSVLSNYFQLLVACAQMQTKKCVDVADKRCKKGQEEEAKKVDDDARD